VQSAVATGYSPGFGVGWAIAVAIFIGVVGVIELRTPGSAYERSET
jgi:hypothetical protein